MSALFGFYECATALSRGISAGYKHDDGEEAHFEVSSGLALAYVGIKQSELALEVAHLQTAAQALELLKQMVVRCTGKHDSFCVYARAEVEEARPILQQAMLPLGGLDLYFRFESIGYEDAVFAAYSEARKHIYVDELKQMTNAEYDCLDNNVELYQVTVNGQLAGGCRFYHLKTPEEKIANGLEIDRDFLLLGKIFVLPRFRSISLCTFMLRCALRRHSGETITILSYAHLEHYYAREFGFLALRWFIPGLCVIMELPKTP